MVLTALGIAVEVSCFQGGRRCGAREGAYFALLSQQPFTERLLANACSHKRLPVAPCYGQANGCGYVLDVAGLAGGVKKRLPQPLPSGRTHTQLRLRSIAKRPKLWAREQTATVHPSLAMRRPVGGHWPGALTRRGKEVTAFAAAVRWLLPLTPLDVGLPALRTGVQRLLGSRGVDSLYHRNADELFPVPQGYHVPHCHTGVVLNSTVPAVVLRRTVVISVVPSVLSAVTQRQHQPRSERLCRGSCAGGSFALSPPALPGQAACVEVLLKARGASGAVGVSGSA